MRQPLDAVLGWPAYHVELLQAFMAEEPPAEVRTEIGVAQLSALAFNRTRTSNDTPAQPADFMVAANAWGPATPDIPDDERQMRAVMQRFANRPETR